MAILIRSLRLLTVLKENSMKKFINKVKPLLPNIPALLIYVFFTIISLPLFTLRKKKIWLICEKPDEARDNGYHLFRYIRLNHPEVWCYYIINQNSKDIEKVIALGNVIKTGGVRHYLYYVNAYRLISSQSNGFLPNWLFGKMFGFRLNRDCKTVFLQHGITQAPQPSLYFPQTDLNLFVCSAKREYEFVRDTFLYPKANVRLLGFTRFDELLTRTEIKNQILIMPTWRAYLFNIDQKQRPQKMVLFKESAYFKENLALLTNNDIQDCLKNRGTVLIFYLHYMMQVYASEFAEEIEKAGCENVIIAKREDHDVQRLLKESLLLITDYSSVYFDFAYMKKPIIHFQYDDEEYHRNHYKKGYFDFKADGFGPVYKSADETAHAIIKCAKNEFNMENTYVERVDNFFIFNDANNCKRNFEAIAEQ